MNSNEHMQQDMYTPRVDELETAAVEAMPQTLAMCKHNISHENIGMYTRTRSTPQSDKKTTGAQREGEKDEEFVKLDDKYRWISDTLQWCCAGSEWKEYL